MEIAQEATILLDVLIAFLLGGVLGFEREWKNKPAGLKTNIIIAGSAALLVSLGRVIILDFNQVVDLEAIGLDPIRMLHAVIVGVSFIGAGTILKSTDDTRIKYLTTSATILMAAGVGMAIALKQYALGIGVTFSLVIVNYLFSILDHLIARKSDFHDQ
jgi:putative Mg2+ transporter-C (MgtC) family protein